MLKELDLSDNTVYRLDGGDSLGFVKGLADGVNNNSELVKLDISRNKLFSGGKALVEVVKGMLKIWFLKRLALGIRWDLDTDEAVKDVYSLAKALCMNARLHHLLRRQQIMQQQVVQQ